MSATTPKSPAGKSSAGPGAPGAGGAGTDGSDVPGGSVADLTYEQARDELVGVVARLEAGGETLEGALALWERGEALAARCQQWLDGARARLDAVSAPGRGDARGGVDGDSTDDADE